MIKIKSETASMKHTRTAACKWIWLHKELICIWCSTLIALEILKSAHQAGSIPLLAHNNIRWVRRSQGIDGWPLTKSYSAKVSPQAEKKKPLQISKFVFLSLKICAVGWLTDQSDSKAADWLSVCTAPTWWNWLKRAQSFLWGMHSWGETSKDEQKCIGIPKHSASVCLLI